jgi:hypothetical protein
MKISVEDLTDFQLQLAFHLAVGYETFEYYPDYKCWRAEMKLGEMRLTSVSIIKDDMSSFHNQIYTRSLCEVQILKDMRSENICLSWNQDKDFYLYYAAFPEINAAHPFLPTAYMKARVKKELGNELDDNVLNLMNFHKARQTKGSPV